LPPWPQFSPQGTSGPSVSAYDAAPIRILRSHIGGNLLSFQNGVVRF
jgi:hypothetical protein